MTDPIKHCPQPDPPELVMRADGYHYQEDEMKDTRRELTDEQLNKELGRYAFAVGVSLNQARHIARAAIAAHVSLNAPADRDVMLEAGHSIPQPEPQEVDMRAVCETLGFDPTNHHNAAKCPYCRQQSQPTPPAEPARKPLFAELIASHEGLAEELKAMDAAPPAEQQGEQEPVIYKRSEFTKGWTTFNVRRECADIAEARLKGPSPSLAELRAEVSRLPTTYIKGTKCSWSVNLADVLALIDKMGVTELMRAEVPGSLDHTLEEDFQHFLSCTGAVKDPVERLRMAYEHGNDRGGKT